jgi:Holliday junction resolvase-like predicted endonuclease
MSFLLSNETELRNHIANLLKQDGYEIQTEVRFPERFRVDICAKKEGMTLAIEVKKESRGIANDIVKCQKLLQLPEVTEVYVAAPELLISVDHVAFATSLGIGVLSVTSKELQWLVKSRRLNGASLSGSRTYPTSVVAGEVFEVKVDVRNIGQKIARSLEARCLSAGPFAFAPGSKRKFTYSSLHPTDSWGVQFLIRTKPSAATGEYPLFTIVTAQNAPASESSLTIKVESSNPKKK